MKILPDWEVCDDQIHHREIIRPDELKFAELRVSIGKPEEMEAFLAGLRAIAPVTVKQAA